MAPAAYAKALNSTSNSAHAFGSTAGSNESDVEKQSAYAFSPSWLNNSTGSSSIRAIHSRGAHSTDYSTGTTSNNIQEGMDPQVRSLTQLSHTRDVPNTFEKNFPTLATNAAEDKQSSAGSVWGNRNLTKEKVISARSPVEEGGPHSSRHNNEHNVQLEKLKALVPKIETKKRSSSSRTKPSLHSARATSLPAQFSRSSSTMSLKSLSTASPPPSANSTPITPKKLAVFRSSQVRQISPVEAKDHSNSPVLETKRFDQESIPVDLHEATKITKLQGLNQSEETSSHHHMDFDEGSRKPNDEAHWRMSSTEYADVYGTHSDDVAIPESHQSSRSETTAYLKDYPGIESEPVYTMAEQLRFLELMRNWTGGSERWENNCGGISISMPSTPRRTPSDLSNKLDDEDQSSVFGSRDSSPGHRSQSSISSLGRLGNTQYSHFGQGSLQMSSGDYTYNQAPLLTPDTQTMYQHLSYINPSDSMVNTDLFNTRPSIDRGQDYQKVPPIYGRHDPYYGQLGLNDEQQHVFNNRTLSHPINRHRPGVYHA